MAHSPAWPQSHTQLFPSLRSVPRPVRPEQPAACSLSPLFRAGAGPRDVERAGWSPRDTLQSDIFSSSPGPGLQHRGGKGQHLRSHWHLRQNHLCGGRRGRRWPATRRYRSQRLLELQLGCGSWEGWMTLQGAARRFQRPYTTDPSLLGSQCPRPGVPLLRCPHPPCLTAVGLRAQRIQSAG